MNMDMQRFHATFFEESREGLEAMEAGLLSLEQGSRDGDLINSIFRAAHSIKGGSATFGFDAIAGLTHVLETLLDELRAGQRAVSPPAVDAMLASVDERAAEKSTVAVATVVLFGTLAMILYPVIYAWVGGGHFDFGIFVGSTVHEVAQVVAIGSTLGGDIAGNAVIAKMIRVMLLVPFLLTLGLVLRGRGVSGAENKPQAKLPIPWFALAFVAMAGVNSLQILPAQVVDALRMAGMLLLTAAMASLGIDTTLARMRQASIQPLLLGGGLFLHLIIIGGLVNWLAA